MPTAIRCHNLFKTYPGRTPVEAVRGIDLEVAEGECFGVLGPNGAGKTTTIEILEGLLDPSSGDVQILGLTWAKDGKSIREKIGITLQDTRFTDKLSVLETVGLFRSFYHQGISPAQAISLVSLQDKAGAWISQLSGGQKQRLAIAVGLVGDPSLLFLDEPTTGLDPTSRRQLWDTITDFRRRGRTVLLTTHYMEEAERLCDRVAIVDQGKIIAHGKPAQLISSIGAAHIIEFTLQHPDQDPISAGQWLDLPGVIEANCDQGCHRLSVSQPHITIPQLLDRLETKGLNLASLTTRHASLEDVFVKLTGRHLVESGDHVP